MKKAMMAVVGLACASAGAVVIRPSVAPDRVKAPLTVDLERIGTLRPRTAAEIGEAGWMVGCECLDRDFADFKAYREFLPPLGIRMIRLQSGWAKCEKARGKYDFAWLDEIVDWAKAHGLECMLETCYGNPLYKNGGNEALMGSTFPSGETLVAWDRWVEALVLHFKDRVTDFEMWNESNNVKENTPRAIAEHNAHTAISVENPIAFPPFRFLIISSIPTNAPERIKSIFLVLTYINGCSGCFLPTIGGTPTISPSTILSKDCCTHSPDTSLVIDTPASFLAILSPSSNTTIPISAALML